MKLVSKSGATSVTVGDQTFAADKNGVFEVPAELAGDLVTAAHGFEPVPEAEIGTKTAPAPAEE